VAADLQITAPLALAFMGGATPVVGAATFSTTMPLALGFMAGASPTGAGAAPTITSVTALSGVALSVAWTGTATEYRLNGGTATALPDGTSPDTITGLTPNTEYTFELRNGAGSWSDPFSGTTDNTGEGGGEYAGFQPAWALHRTSTIGAR
jgi:hypothetical protein